MATAIALRPACSTSCLVSSSFSTRRAPSATSAPASASALANATPRPEEAPVTIATLSSSRNRSSTPILSSSLSMPSARTLGCRAWVPHSDGVRWPRPRWSSARCSALPGRGRTALVGAVLAFGAGALISAVSFDLVEEGSQARRPGHGRDRPGDRRAHYFAARPRRSTGPGLSSGGAALALGAFLDGIPEQMVLGIGLAAGEGVGVGLLVAIFVSNLPEAIGSATDMAPRAAARGRSASCGSPSPSSARSPRSAATRSPTARPTTSGRSSTASRPARCW